MDELANLRKQNEILTRTTELLAKAAAPVGDTWPAIQNAAHKKAAEDWEAAHQGT